MTVTCNGWWWRFLRDDGEEAKNKYPYFYLLGRGVLVACWVKRRTRL